MRLNAVPRWSLVLALAALLILVWLVLEVSARASQAAVLRADPEDVLSAPALRRQALMAGKAVYDRRCASCHGRNGQGDRGLGVPDMTQGQPLYGEGRVADIEFVARHGVRSADKSGFNLASMPAYASPRPYDKEPLPPLSPAQIEDLTQFVLAFTGRASNPAAAAEGDDLYHNFAGCYDCHGPAGEGDTAIGAPRLTGRTWLYGDGSHDAIFRSIAGGRAGSSPAFARTLNAAELRDVAAYMAALRRQGGSRPK